MRNNIQTILKILRRNLELNNYTRNGARRLLAVTVFCICLFVYLLFYIGTTYIEAHTPEVIAKVQTYKNNCEQGNYKHCYILINNSYDIVDNGIFIRIPDNIEKSYYKSLAIKILENRGLKNE